MNSITAVGPPGKVTLTFTPSYFTGSTCQLKSVSSVVFEQIAREKPRWFG